LLGALRFYIILHWKGFTSGVGAGSEMA
jgi:hypothetical protein